MKKKGVTKTLMFMIIIIASLLIILFLWHPIFKFIINMLLPAQTCKMSVWSNTAFNVQGIEFVKNINCPTQYKTLEGDEEKLKKQIADEMWMCWDNFGQGKYELFDAKTEKFCVVCSVIEFEDKNEKIEDFVDYLINAPFKGKDYKTYYEAFTGYATQPEKIEETPENFNDAIDTSKKYAISFVYAKQDYWSRLERAGVWGTVGLTVGLAAGGILLVSGYGTIAGVAILAATLGTAGAIGGAASGGANADWQAGITILPFEDMKDLDCTYIPSTQNQKT